MLRPPSPAWLTALPLLLTFSATAAWAQRRTPVTKPGVAIRPPYQSPATRAPSAPRTPMPRGDTVPLPFNLQWGDTQQRLASLFAGVGAKIAEKKPVGQGETWRVEGLIAPGLQASLFTFQQGILASLEFDYGQADWDLGKYNEIMGQLRRRLDGLCGGTGEMISRKTEQPPADSGIKQVLMGYEWKRGDTLVQLFYFSAEEQATASVYRTISVHYYYQDPMAEAAAREEKTENVPMPDSGPIVSVPSQAPTTPATPPKPKQPGDAESLPEK